MTTSVSTPRLRLTLIWYLGLIGAAALLQPGVLVGAVIPFVDALALLLVAVAVLGRIWCSVHIAGRKDEQLVVDGPYGACRHPLYTLSLLGGAGLGLATHSLLLTVATIALLAGLFLGAVKSEESMLAARHGTAFVQYVATTPRFWPRFTQSARLDRLEIRPPVLWKAFVDAGAFLLLYVLVLLAGELRMVFSLPALLTLP